MRSYRVLKTMLKNLVAILKNNELLTFIEVCFISVHIVGRREKKQLRCKYLIFPWTFQLELFFFSPDDLRQESGSFQSKV